LHPLCEPLRPLLGTWRGDGDGHYPTVEPFGYVEEVSFGHVGKPFLAYSQRTKHATDGRPLHAETGYLRMPRPTRVEFVVAHPTGIVEVATGHFDGARMWLRSTLVVGTDTAKDVTTVERDFEIDASPGGDVLRYALRMAAVGVPLTHHLAAELRRQG